MTSAGYEYKNGSIHTYFMPAKNAREVGLV